MRSKLPIRRAAWIAVLAASALFGLDTSKLKPTGYVNDFAHVLDPAGKQRLEAYCGNLERVTGAQMAIVLVDTLDGDPRWAHLSAAIFRSNSALTSSKRCCICSGKTSESRRISRARSPHCRRVSDSLCWKDRRAPTA